GTGCRRSVRTPNRRPPNPIYTLATLDGLLNPNSDNPLYDAGVEEANPDDPDTGRFLDVYDAALIRGFEPGFLDVEGNEVPVRSVSIPQEQLSLAALAVVQLNYRIVDE